MIDELLPFAFAFTSLAVGASIAVSLARARAKRLEKRAGAHGIPARSYSERAE